MVQPLHQTPRLDPSTHGGELGDEGIDDDGTAALDHRPAVAVRQRGEQTGKDAGERSRERQHGVGRRARHERPAFLGAETPSQVLGRRKAAEREAGRRERVRGHVAHGAEKRGQDSVQVPDEGSEQPGIGIPVGPQRTGHVVNLGPDGHGACPIERMGEGHRRAQQADPAGGEIDVAEGGRGQQKRVHR